MERSENKQEKGTWKILALALVIAPFVAVVGATLTAMLFVKPGPQGATGETGQQGP